MWIRFKYGSPSYQISSWNSISLDEKNAILGNLISCEKKILVHNPLGTKRSWREDGMKGRERRRQGRQRNGRRRSKLWKKQTNFLHFSLLFCTNNLHCLPPFSLKSCLRLNILNIPVFPIDFKCPRNFGTARAQWKDDYRWKEGYKWVRRAMNNNQFITINLIITITWCSINTRVGIQLGSHEWLIKRLILPYLSPSMQYIMWSLSWKTKKLE